METKIRAVWRAGLGIYKADATKVANEILDIGEEATAQQVLDYGRNENTELHKCFEWNDDIAAEKYRLSQARDVIRNLVFIRSEEQIKQDAPEIRVFHKTERTEESGYKPLTRIIKDENEYQNMLKLAYAELHSFKMRYQHLQELDYILSLIP